MGKYTEYDLKEEKEDERRRYMYKARTQLEREGKIGFCGSDESIGRKHSMINNRTKELMEKDELERLKRKYD